MPPIKPQLPKLFVDHIDRIKNNNSWDNLRDCSNSENLRNRIAPKNNSSGIKGVGWHKKTNKWVARCRVNYKEIYIGLFLTKNEAETAYLEFTKQRYGEFMPI